MSLVVILTFLICLILVMAHLSWTHVILLIGTEWTEERKKKTLFRPIFKCVQLSWKREYRYMASSLDSFVLVYLHDLYVWWRNGQVTLKFMVPYMPWKCERNSVLEENVATLSEKEKRKQKFTQYDRSYDIHTPKKVFNLWTLFVLKDLLFEQWPNTAKQYWKRCRLVYS